MESFKFVDMYFHSQNEIVDIRESELRDINTLFSYLNNLHSLADKMKDKFDIKLANYPEFKVLRILRNYFHHVDDIDELRIYVNLEHNVSPYHLEQMIIPMRVWAESASNFVSKNTVPESHGRYKDKQKFIKKEFDSILDICDCVDVLNDPKAYCTPLLLKCDDEVIELGFDIFKFIYNISNVIADECRKIPELASKKVIKELDDSYCEDNNILKYDLMLSPGVNCILTTNGFIYPSSINKAI